jgi:hypothetical protein
MRNLNCCLIGILLLICTSVFAEQGDAKKKLELLSPISIFKPLLADPKWPRFTLAYNYYIRGAFKKYYHVFSPNFGASLPLGRIEDAKGRQYELGVQGGLFATMDIDSTPTRLINADYFIGPTLAIKDNQWDYMLRVSHTSSHLGDEFLLSHDGIKIKRINLSYETAEAIVAYNFDNGLRPYIGGGYIVHAEPSGYKTPEFIYGFDYRSTEFLLDHYAKPIFGAYSKVSSNFGWHPNLSIKGGLEFQDKFVIGKELQLLLEYYNGHSIHGQFYKSREHYLGTSININF